MLFIGPSWADLSIASNEALFVVDVVQARGGWSALSPQSLQAISRLPRGMEADSELKINSGV